MGGSQGQAGAGEHKCLPHRNRRQAHSGYHRPRQSEWTGIFAGRKKTLCHRVEGHTEPQHLVLRCWNRRLQPVEQDEADRRRRSRRTRWLPGRSRRQSLVRLGLQRGATAGAGGCEWPQDLSAQGQVGRFGRGQGFQCAGQAAGVHPFAGTLRKFDLRRAKEQSLVYGFMSLDLRPLR